MLLCLLSGGPPSTGANQRRAARGIIMTYCSYDTEYHGVWVCNSFHYRASRSSSDGGGDLDAVRRRKRPFRAGWRTTLEPASPDSQSPLSPPRRDHRSDPPIP